MGANKYGNVWTEYNGVKYQSKKEANYARELDLRVRAHDIERYERQVRFPIEMNDVKICTYICDFVVYDKNGVSYIDVKGYRNPNDAAYKMYLLKKKLVKAFYGIELQEV